MPGATPPAQLGDESLHTARRRRAGADRDLRARLRVWPLARHRWPASRLHRPALAGQPEPARSHGVGAPRTGAVMPLRDRFAPERLVAAACEEAGSDDFGAEGWRPGLHRLTDGLINDARLSEIGVEIAHLD